MRKKNAGLSEKETKFVESYTLLGKPVEAATFARFANPYDAAKHLMKRDVVVSAIRAKQAEFIFEQALPVANKVVLGVLTSTIASNRDKLAAAKIVYAEARIVLGIESDKELHEMTVDELAHKHLEIQQEIERAVEAMKDITPVEGVGAFA